MHCKSILIFSFLASLSLTANANDSIIKLNDNKGWYIGALAGSASPAQDTENHYENTSASTISGIYWGVNFVNWLGLESSLVVIDDVVKKQDRLLDSSYFMFTVTPKVNIQFHTRFSLFAKAGYTYFSYSEKYEADSSIFEDDDEEEFKEFFSSNDDGDQSWSTVLPVYSLGGEFRIIKGLEARLTYDHVEGTLPHSTGLFSTKLPNVDVNLDIVTVSAHYQF